MPKSYSDRVMAFRRGVYAGRDKLTPGAQVLLLRLSDGMNANAIVSIPRSQLAEEFGCPYQRITEWVRQAKDAGYLSTVRRGRPGVTAVYQGLRVAREGVPSDMARITKPRGARQSVPAEARESSTPRREVVPSGEVRSVPQHRDQGSDGEPCRWHGFAPCPEECPDHGETRRESA